MATIAAMYVAVFSLLGGPTIAPVDDNAAAISIGHLVPGSRLAVFGAGRPIASGVALGAPVRLPVDGALVPGTALTVLERVRPGVQLAASVIVQHDYVT